MHRLSGKNDSQLMRPTTLLSVLLVALGIAILSLVTTRATAQPQDELTDGTQVILADQAEVVSDDQPTGKVIGIKNVCVHVLKLEKTLKLYLEILGFKMKDASVLHGPGIEGLLVMELQANDCLVHLSLPAPGSDVGPIGNTNHNHFMLLVDNIVPICDKLKEQGYELENNNYAKDKYSFFTGPNGEIVGLTEHR